MSFSARAVVSVLRLVKKMGLIPKPGDIDSEIAKAKAYNKRHPYREPSDRKAQYSTEYAGGYPLLVIRQHASTHNKAILFLHGGGDADTWKPEVSFARNYGKQTGADVFYPIYPPFTEASVPVTADLIYEVYKTVAERYGAKNVSVVGGSYGGFLAMQLITWINRNDNAVDMPALLMGAYGGRGLSRLRLLVSDGRRRRTVTPRRLPTGRRRIWAMDPACPQGGYVLGSAGGLKATRPRLRAFRGIQSPLSAMPMREASR